MRARALALMLATLGVAGALLLHARPRRRSGEARTPKAGGVLNVMPARGAPAGLRHPRDLHDRDRVAGLAVLQQPGLFDPLKPRESVDTIVGELAEKWSWQDDYRNLVFFLRKNVKWHDGQPFTSKDVKFTFDMVREAPDAPAKLRHQSAQGLVRQHRDHRGGRPVHGGLPPQAAPAVDPDDARLGLIADLRRPRAARAVRTACVGTGPFKLKEWRRGEFVEYVKNPDYFVKGRPYLDGLRYVVIKERGTRRPRCRPGGSTPPCRARRPRPPPSSSRKPCRRWCSRAPPRT